MHRVRAHLRLLEACLAGVLLSVGNAYVWWLLIGNALNSWGVVLIATPTTLFLMALTTSRPLREIRRRPQRRAHARPTTDTHVRRAA
ncbi:hypothetical protein [Streptomyces longwoodensis]|uniref:hypothetical protein n=1 Tax=Streptomyces longwoodensis TaxID=68231 RepID=UPI00225A5C90|nr:hypothetical protein [Streptomyces longwoodensis]MCX5000916.1 hypothetical protein [Streptomyces longwoodensis]